MHNFLLMNKSKELEDLSTELGFEKTFFSGEDFIILDEDFKKNLLRNIDRNKQKLIIYRAKTDEMLRFALERTKVNMVMGMEQIHLRDSVHFVRGGLDQVLCKIAAEKGKIIVFSFSNLLNTVDKGKLMARMMLNIKLCKKYKVKMLFSTFAVSKMEMRSRNDLEAFWRVLGGERL